MHNKYVRFNINILNLLKSLYSFLLYTIYGILINLIYTVDSDDLLQ